MGLLSSLIRSLDDLIAQGYPPEVAERIVSGELDPSFEARMARASDRFDIENPEYTGSMELIGDVNTPIWSTQNPSLAATYANPRKGGNITPVFLDREGVSTVRADGTRWNNINDSGRSTNDYMRKAQDYGLPSVAFRDVRDVGPYTARYPRDLLEQAFQPSNTTVTLDPTKIRSINAMFDPEYKGPNILGATAGTAGALGLLAAPEDAEAGVSKAAIQAAMAGVRTPQEFLSALERLGASPEQAAQIARGELSPIKAGVSSQNAGLIPTIGRDGELIDARFDPRVNSRIRNAQLETGILSRGTMDDIPRVALSDLEGQRFVTSMSDRTAAGGLLESINGVSLNNLVNLQGGQGFMFENPGMVWASARNPVNQILDAAGGDNVFYVPWRMSTSGGDFATMTGETMLSYASANMGKAEKKALDKIVREYKTTGTWDKETKTYKNAGLNIGEWKGVDDPSSIDAWRNAPDALRKELLNAMDVNFRDKGGLSIGEARLSVTDPKQRFAMDGGIQNVGQIFGGRPAITSSGHPSYPAGVPGQGVGQLDKLDMSIFDLIPDARIGSDQVLVRDAVDPTKPHPEALRALQMKPYTGTITEDILKNLDARGVNVNDLAPVVGGGAALGLLAAPEDASAMESPSLRSALEEAGVIGDTLVPTKRPLGERAMGVVDRILTGLEVPQRGVQGLAATGYGLLSGEDFDTATSRGADVVSQGVEESAREFGDYVFDLTGSPAAATAAYTTGILGSP